MRRARGLSLRKWLAGITILLSLLLIIILLLYQRYFTSYVGSLYQANLNITMEQVTGNIHQTFSTMNEMVADIEGNVAVREYVTTNSSSDRYKRIRESVGFVVDMATAKLPVDQFLVMDSTNAWFRFVGQLSNEACAVLRETFSGSGQGAVNTVLTLDGVPYFCTAKRVVVNRGAGNETVGLVVALMEINKTRQSLTPYEGYSGIAIALHDFEHVLVALDEAQDGVALAELAAFGDGHFLVEQVILPGSLGVSISVPQGSVFPQRLLLAAQFFSIGAFVVVAILLLALFINRLLVKPFEAVIEGTQLLGDKDLSRRLEDTGVQHVDKLIASINGMLTRLEDYNEREMTAMQDLYELEIAQQRAQMYLLRHQINRHFLYNSLSSVRSLVQGGETDKAGEVVDGIAQLLRYTSSSDEEVNLFQELEVVQHYVRIQNIRFGEIIRLETEVDDQLCEYCTLKLVVQPLVENAIVHGLEGRSGNCELRLMGWLKEDGIHIRVMDNGKGIPAEKLARIRQNLVAVESRNIYDGLDGIALLNVQKRIQTKYGAGFGLSIDSTENLYTAVSLHLPAILDK